MRLNKRRYALLPTILLAVAGLVTFYFVDDPFAPAFMISLFALVGGVLLSGFLLSFWLIRSARRWRRVIGYISTGVLMVVVLLVAIAYIDIRVFFFYKKMSPDDWRQDLKTLTAEIERTHPLPYGRVGAERFRADVASLDERLATLDDEQAALGLLAVLADAGDGHTTSLPFQPAMEAGMYPLQLYHFTDGLYVTDASPQYRELIGQKVVRIGNATSEAAYDKIKPLISTDNEQGVVERIPLYYACASLLRAEGLTASDTEATWEFADEAGNRSEHLLKAVSPVRYLYWYLRPLHRFKYGGGAPPPETPMYLTHDIWDYYWLTWIESSKTIYVQINQIQNKSDESMTAFGERIVSMANELGAERVVIDLRRNGGGDNTVTRGFVDAIAASASVNRRGHLFTLIGRGTFSAAVNLTTALEQRTNTIFVGEPTRAGPNHSGDPRLFKLPNSKIIYFVSTRRWQLSTPDDTRTAHEPQVYVPLSHTDFFANRDPVLQAALDY